MLANVKAYKTLTEKSGFYGEGLRHIFEPYANYSYRFEPNVTPGELFQFDEVDTLDKENTIRFGMRNFIQAKRGETGTRVANFLDADLFTSYHLETEGEEEDFGSLEGDIELSLTDRSMMQMCPSPGSSPLLGSEYMSFASGMGTSDVSSLLLSQVSKILGLFRSSQWRFIGWVGSGAVPTGNALAVLTTQIGVRNVFTNRMLSSRVIASSMNASEFGWVAALSGIGVFHGESSENGRQVPGRLFPSTISAE